MSQDGQDRSADDARRDQVGTVGEEAAKLFGALSDWARDQGSGLGEGVAGLAGHAARSIREVDEHIATGAQECAYCPVCRTVHVLRQTSPEVRAQLATAATSLMHAAAGLVATVVPDDRPESSGVERIDLDDDPGDWPEDTDPEEGDR